MRRAIVFSFGGIGLREPHVEERAIVFLFRVRALQPLETTVGGPPTKQNLWRG